MGNWNAVRISIATVKNAQKMSALFMKNSQQMKAVVIQGYRKNSLRRKLSPHKPNGYLGSTCFAGKCAAFIREAARGYSFRTSLFLQTKADSCQVGCESDVKPRMKQCNSKGKKKKKKNNPRLNPPLKKKKKKKKKK